MYKLNFEKILKMLILVLSLAPAIFLENTTFIYIGAIVYFLVHIYFKLKNKKSRLF